MARVEAPALVRPLRDRHRGPRAERPLPPVALAHGQSLLAVDVVERFRGLRCPAGATAPSTPVHPPALAPQHQMQAPISWLDSGLRRLWSKRWQRARRPPRDRSTKCSKLYESPHTPRFLRRKGGCDLQRAAPGLAFAVPLELSREETVRTWKTPSVQGCTASLPVEAKHGARGEIRTRTAARPRDFKSPVSTVPPRGPGCDTTHGPGRTEGGIRGPRPSGAIARAARD